MHLRSTLLLFWAGVCAASVAATLLVIAAEVCTRSDGFSAGPLPRVCRTTDGAGAPLRPGAADPAAASA